VKLAMQKQRVMKKQGMRRALGQTADDLTWKADARALQWMLMCLGEDYESEGFLDGLPGLSREFTSLDLYYLRTHRNDQSKWVTDKLLKICSSTRLLPEQARRERLTACLGAIWCFHGTIKTL
jgi:hypothetical protein